jgi:RNA polymerase sigma factor (sigma-70 family)
VQEFAVSTTALTGDKPATVVPIQRALARRMAVQQHHNENPTDAREHAISADEGASDATLITDVRAGQISSYGVLYRRHRDAAAALARRLSRSASDADDLVSEAFAKLLDTLRGERGPDVTFRSYLLTTLRHIAYDKTRHTRRLHLTEDIEITALDLARADLIAEPFDDTAVAALEHSMVTTAFAQLPRRWQEVLWHSEIQELSPADVAPLMNLTPNGVSALAYRAREGLRQEYLQAYLAQPQGQPENCRLTATKFGAWSRGKLRERESAQVEDHLGRCWTCRAVVAELRQELPA